MASSRSYELIKLGAINLQNAMEDFLLVIQAERTLFQQNTFLASLREFASPPSDPAVPAEQNTCIDTLEMKIRSHHMNVLSDERTLRGYIWSLEETVENYTKLYWALDRVTALGALGRQKLEEDTKTKDGHFAFLVEQKKEQYKSLLQKVYQRGIDLALVNLWMRITNGKVECGRTEMASMSQMIGLSKHDTLCDVGREMVAEGRWSDRNVERSHVGGAGSRSRALPRARGGAACIRRTKVLRVNRGARVLKVGRNRRVSKFYLRRLDKERRL